MFLLGCAAHVQLAKLKFEDYPATETWNGRNAPVQLRTASERMFKTNLTNAAKENLTLPDTSGSPAGVATRLVPRDRLLTFIQVSSMRPWEIRQTNGWDRWIFAGGITEGQFAESRRDSRLVIVRNGPDVRAYVWEKDCFWPAPLPLA